MGEKGNLEVGKGGGKSEFGKAGYEGRGRNGGVADMSWSEKQKLRPR